MEISDDDLNKLILLVPALADAELEIAALDGWLEINDRDTGKPADAFKNVSEVDAWFRGLGFASERGEKPT